MKARYDERSIRISITITDREPTFRWGRIHPSHERFSRRKWGPSWQCRKSVDCITATNDGLPEKRQNPPRYALPPPGALKSVSELCFLEHACIGEFRSSDSARAANCWSFAVRLRRMTSVIGCTEFSLGTDDCDSLPRLLEKLAAAIDRFAVRDGYDLRS